MTAAPAHARFAGLDLLASSVLLLGPVGEVRYANPAAENLLELSLKSLQRAPPGWLPAATFRAWSRPMR